MRKFLGFLFVVTGSVFSLFLINVFLCLFIPSYHDALALIVRGNEKKEDTTISFDEEPKIPLSDGEFRNVDADRDGDSEWMNTKGSDVDYTDPDRVTGLVTDTTKGTEIEQTTGDNSKDQDDEKANRPEIVDKTYHEDCGSDGGYWVITYSDGSIGIE
ncbi:hypothetical protein [Butyrivibrio proteoclasticus]|uniref:hypothetical protein n=1 Tax=Butyrivibrio proteoclasticus TaxID=43305 RepID=UPI00047D51EC|nr:hypothetical protein [Butyrivibrio proteoclasticus]